MTEEFGDTWLVVVRNDAWEFPDVFGPFDNRTLADEFVDRVIDHNVVQWEDINVQLSLSPDYYEEE